MSGHDQTPVSTESIPVGVPVLAEPKRIVDEINHNDNESVDANENLNHQAELIIDEEALNNQISESHDLVFTDAAAAKVKTLIAEENNNNLKLRVFITGGGCSGFQYGFTFDEEVNDDDFSIEKDDVTLLVDAQSYQYLSDAEIDYKDDLEGSRFVIRNPQATTTCGCGSSFSVD